MHIDATISTVFVPRMRFQVSGKVDAIAYPEHWHLKPYTQKRNKNRIKVKDPSMSIFTTPVVNHNIIALFPFILNWSVPGSGSKGYNQMAQTAAIGCQRISESRPARQRDGYGPFGWHWTQPVGPVRGSVSRKTVFEASSFWICILICLWHPIHDWWKAVL